MTKIICKIKDNKLFYLDLFRYICIIKNTKNVFKNL